MQKAARTYVICGQWAVSLTGPQQHAASLGTCPYTPPLRSFSSKVLEIELHVRDKGGSGETLLNCDGHRS